MPGRNILKYFVENNHYHVYNRGLNKTAIFKGEQDYAYFTWTLARSLSLEPVKDPKGRDYKWLRGKVQLEAYCLMPNHFHLLFYEVQEGGIRELMQSVSTAYSMYFNKKYERRGPLFENVYRAVLIESDEQLQHITRYIHLNNADFREWPHSSYVDYLTLARNWIAPEKSLELFANLEEYKTFVEDYKGTQREREAIKRELY